MEKHPKYKEKDYKEALIGAFLRIDELLVTEEGKKEINQITETLKSMGVKDALGGFEADEDEEDGATMKGCTANVMLIKDGKIYVANAGDSRSIVIYADEKVEELSSDHKPDKEVETARITKAGGSIFNGRVEGNLNLSRALGDMKYKSNKSLKPEEQMITAYPDVTVKELTPNVQYVLMGCDGVYETRSSADIGAFILSTVKSTSGIKLTEVASKLLDVLISPDCIKTGGAGCDNMTSILIRFKHP